MKFLFLCATAFFSTAILADAQCPPADPKGFMVSWAGQPGRKDQTDTRTVEKYSLFACLATAAPKSSVPAACYLSFENGGHYTLKPHEAMKSQKTDVVTLTCNGQQPTCCQVQVVTGLGPDPK